MLLINTSFIKIPIDIVYKFGNELNYLFSIGYYFGSNVSSSVSTESLDGIILSTIPIEMLGENDYGLRFKQGIILPVLEKFQLQTGLLQEVGLKEFWSNTKHFNFGCFIAVRFGFGD